MKSIYARLLLSLFLVCGSIGISTAQVEKGDNLLGFSGSVSTQSAFPSSISITGLISYERYLSQNWAVGIAPYINAITAKGSLTTIFGTNVFGNYGFITKGAKFYPYVGLLLSFNYSISTGSSGNDLLFAGINFTSGNSTIAFYGAGAKAGSKYFLSDRVNLDLNVNYSANISSVVNGEEVNLGEGGILQVFIGVGVIIGKKAGI